MSFYNAEGCQQSLRVTGLEPPSLLSPSLQPAPQLSSNEQSMLPLLIYNPPEVDLPVSQQAPASHSVSSSSLIQPPTESPQKWSPASSDIEGQSIAPTSQHSVTSPHMLSYQSQDPPVDHPPNNQTSTNTSMAPSELPSPYQPDSVDRDLQCCLHKLEGAPPTSITTHSSVQLREPPSTVEDNQIVQLHQKVDSFIQTMCCKMSTYKEETLSYLANSTTMLETIIKCGIDQIDRKITEQFKVNVPQNMTATLTPVSPLPMFHPMQNTSHQSQPASLSISSTPICNAPDPPSTLSSLAKPSKSTHLLPPPTAPPKYSVIPSPTKFKAPAPVSAHIP